MPRSPWLAAAAALLLLLAGGLVASRWPRSRLAASDPAERQVATAPDLGKPTEPAARPAEIPPIASPTHLAAAGGDPSPSPERSPGRTVPTSRRVGSPEPAAASSPAATLATTLLAGTDPAPTQLQMVTAGGTRIIWLLRREAEI